MPRWPDMKLCGRKKRSGGTCQKPAGWGTDHKGYGMCRTHGGNSPTSNKSAYIAKARDMVMTFGLPREISPVQAILEEVQRTAGHVAWLGQQVGDLTNQELTRGVTKVQVFPDGSKVTNVEAAVNVWVKMYQEERKHLVQVCKAGVEIGLKEIEISIAQRQGELLAQVITAILNDMSLTKKQVALIPKVVPRHLQAVARSEAEDILKGEVVAKD